MFQVPFPTARPDSVNVPLPEAFEHWRDLYLHSAGQKLLVFVALAVLLYLVVRIARRMVQENIEEVNRRHILRKWIGYGYAFLLSLIALALFAESLTGLGTILAVLVAGIAVALQDILKSIVGWLFISSRAGIEVGSRIEVGGVVGDVIDIGVLKTTMLEVGNLVYGRQSTGRLVTIPNYRILSDHVFVAAADSPFVWQEVKVTVTFESDWARAEQVLREIGDELHAEIAPELEVGFRRLERRYAFKYGTLTPIVYVSLAPSGVDLTLRFLVHVRRRRGSVDRVSRRILLAFAEDPRVELAYPTYRMFRLGEAPAGRTGAADLYPDGRDLPTDQRVGMGGEEGLPPPDMLERDG